jgi:hypothetical protein
MFSLQDYQQEKQRILSDDRYSKTGKEDALAKLESRYESEARKAIKSLRKQAVETALKLRDAQEKRFSLVEDAQAKIDYARLNYEAQAIKSKLTAVNSISDVMQVWDSVKRSNDAYAIKAFKDTSQGLITEKFGDDYTDMRGSLFEDMQNTRSDIVKVETSKDELEAQNELRKIQDKASEVNEAFGSGQAVINRVMDGIGFESGKVKLGFDYEINKLSDRQEKPYEVFNRIESEREKALDQYQSILKEKGLDGVIDSDFDDLKDVL